MFGSLGVWEIALIMVLALLLFGPRKLPEIGRTLGKGLAEFKKASNELKRSIETEVEEEERTKRALPPASLESSAAPAAAAVASAPEHTEPGRQDLV
jgi:sec-independent protein translocase protein TatA